jgi:TolB-like protein/DNA-binding winged helix-turn-helix (wHTH) protein
VDRQAKHLLEFGPFRMDLEERVLMRDQETITLSPKAFETLLVLVQHSERVVLKDDLMKTLWPDTFVEESNLSQHIFQLRKALGDRAHDPEYIVTVPGRGYRFAQKVTELTQSDGDLIVHSRSVHSVTLEETESTEALASFSRLRQKPWNWIVGVATAVSLLAVASAFVVRMRRPPAIHSLAVLPLQNLSSDAAQEYFADGMTDGLITNLAQIESIKVTSRTSSMQYKQTKKSLPEIARELNVDGIIEGTVQRSGDRVRITAQLIYGPSDKHIWANSYERDLRDVFALERDVTEDIARQIQARLTTNQGAEKAQLRPMDPKALEAYLQGNYHMNKQGSGSGDEEKRKAAGYFEQAIVADPNFVPAYRGLVLAHKNRLLGSSEDVAIIRQTAEKVAQIDKDNSAERVNLALLKWMPDLDWRGAAEDLRQAVALNPNRATAHSALCILLVVLGDVDEGLRECRIAQRVDPFDEDSALGLYLGRDYDSSIATLRRMLQKDPKDGYAHCYIFQDYSMKGMYKESIQELGQCFLLFGQPEVAANIERAFEASGYQGAMQQWAKEIEHLQTIHQAFLPGTLAQAYAILGDHDRAFYWLEQAYEHREMVSFDGGVFFLSAEPMYDPLRSDPRFKDLLRRVGLPQ